MDADVDDLTPDNQKTAPATGLRQPITIVFFATQLYPVAMGEKSGFGGAETEMWNLARALSSDRTFNVRVVTHIDTPDPNPLETSPRLYPVPPPSALTYNDSWLKRRKAVFRYYAMLFQRLKQQQADIYYAKLASGEAMIVWLAARVLRSKFVFRVEHDWETNHADLTHNIFRGKASLARVFVRCLKTADLVIVQTTRQAEQLRKNFGVRSTLIPNGHQVPAPETVQGNPAVRTSVLWVGRAHPMKRPKLFLDMAMKFPGQDFIMVMPPEPDHAELFAAIHHRATELTNVTFIPGAASDDLDAYYRKARLFVLTSEAEGFSNVVLEAIKNGCPILTYDHNPNGLLCQPDSANNLEPAPGYCVQDDIGLALAITRKLLTDDSLWKHCQQTLQATIDPFKMENVVATYKKSFQALARESR